MLQGFHHVTAIAGDPQRNLDFYTGFLGLRLVKRTVNFDDPGTHHFYFGDYNGTPGTLLTFFPWPGSRRKSRRGAGQILSVAFHAASVASWKSRAEAAGVPCSGPSIRQGEIVLQLTDPDGLPIELVEGGTQEIGRLHSIAICEAETGYTAGLLAKTLGFARVSGEGVRERFEIAGGAGRIDVVTDPSRERGLTAPGTVHHVAFALGNTDVQDEWRSRLTAEGFRVTLPQNRVYFRSIYFRQPRGVLFELATSAPGFTLDETPGQLGTRLCLPPWLEPDRQNIEQRLAPVNFGPVYAEPRNG
jgi:glyoxalase family protein